MRGVGITEWLNGVVPPVLAPLFFALTFLGDPVFLVGMAPVVYWLGPRVGVITRENGARLLAVTLGALALTVLLKYGFALPRPPVRLHRFPEDGFGFPSGHATGSAAVYGALAALSVWRDRGTRYALAAGMIVLVALTRLLLGVHYLVDVVAGIAAGVAFAALIVRLSERRIRDGFRLAALVGLATPLVVWPAYDAAAAVGGALGALLVWEWRGDWLQSEPWRISLPVAAVGFVGLGGIAGVTYVLEPAAPIVVAVNVLTGAGFVGLPLVQDRLAALPGPQKESVGRRID